MKSRGDAVVSPQQMVERAKSRECGACQECGKDPACGWRQGLLRRQDRPDRLGLIFEARVIESRPVISARETRTGALDSPKVNACLQAVGRRWPVIVASFSGEVLGVLGEDLRAREVLETIKGSREDGGQEEN